MKCGTCPAERNGDRAGGGWKNHVGRYWCPDCWRRSFMLRAITVPIAGPVDCDWAELRTVLKSCWAAATSLANWATTELYRHDVVRTPDMGRLGKYPVRLYLYPDARRVVPEMDPTSVTALLQAVEGKYRKRRLAVVWARSESLPNYRYPVPYPVHNQAWSASRGEGGETLLSVRLGGARRTLRLRGGPDFRRQLRAVQRLIDGEAIAGELALYEVPVSANANRAGGEERAAGGGRRHATRIMAKMVLWLPKEQRTPRGGTLFVHNEADSFWVYHVDHGEPHYLRADHVKRWVADARRLRQRMADDLKHEKRWPKDVRRRMVESQEARLRKQHHRLDSFVHESTVMLSKFAERQGVSTVVYDMTVKSFADSFPWHMVRERLAYKLDERGITLEVVERERPGGAENPAAAREDENP